MTRRELPLTGPEALATDAAYRLLTATVVPRPIAWVASRSASGVDNLAPHSFFTVASHEPPTICFTSVGRKDPLTNIEATRDFVVHLVPEPMMDAANATATDYPCDVSEIDEAGLTREPARVVAATRIRESPVALECRLRETVEVGACTIVLGEVVHIAVDESVLDGDHPRIDALRPWARLGGTEWGQVGEVRSLARVPFSALTSASG